MSLVDLTRARLRYDLLLGWAGHGRGLGRTYAAAVARADLALDAARTRVAVERIQRWTGMSAAAARGTYYSSLVSEAREEADSALFMRDPGAFARWLPDATDVPRPEGPVLYATLHFGHPVLSCVYLRRCAGIDVRPIIRGLDDGNPMADPKRGWGQRKVGWTRDLLDGAVFGVDGLATVRAREHLLNGGAVFAALDVPGDVSDRSSTVDVGGERLRFSTGVVSLAQMTRSTIVPVVAVSGTEQMGVRFGTPVVSTDGDPFPEVFAELSRFILEDPGEWWLWPFVHGDG
ncbi:MAG: hypothetical protein P8R42_30090 [Candidatus Binatia bacterium]|nr:hypothetical protein [Candidatus Binatia bacterium]